MRRADEARDIDAEGVSARTMLRETRRVAAPMKQATLMPKGVSARVVLH